MYQQNDYDENRQQLRARSLTVGLPMAALLIPQQRHRLRLIFAVSIIN